MTRYKGPRRARAITHATLGLQWLMEPFFCPSTRKKLPGRPPPERSLLAIVASLSGLSDLFATMTKLLEKSP
jgi:hypothetical protein